MDSITHLAAGALTPLAFARAPRLGAVVLFGIVAGELPDIDVLAGVSAQAMLDIHRGPTHSIPALLLFATLLAVLCRAWLRRAARRQEEIPLPGPLPARQKAGDWPFLQIWLAALLALALHVYLDSMTTFGTRVFWPVSDLRVALPALFIIDPLFTLPLLGVLVYCLLGLRRSVQTAGSAAVSKNGRDKTALWARRALVWVIVYPLVCLGLNGFTGWKLNKDLAESGLNGGAGRVHLTTTPLSPFLWKAVQESEQEYRLATVSLFGVLAGKEPEFGQAYPRVVADPATHWAALRGSLDICRSYSAFASYPVVRSSVSEPGTGLREITFEDLRYTPAGADDLSGLYDRGGSMFLLQVRLDDSAGQLLAWRYLSAFDAMDSAGWVELETPIPLN